jgi:hypothetical protein
MTYYTERLMQENRKYKKFIEDFQLGVNLFPLEKNVSKLKGSMREEVQSPLMDKMGLNMSVWNPAKNNLPNFRESPKAPDNCFKKINSDNKKKSKKNFYQISQFEKDKRFSGGNIEYLI